MIEKEDDLTKRDAEFYERQGGAVPMYYQPVKPEYGAAKLDEPRHPGSQRFHEILRSVGDMHDKKQRDYGTGTDPFANVRASQDFGVPAWLGAVIRMNDKVSRLKTAGRQVIEDGEANLSNEGVEDSLLDIAVYAIIALVLLEEDGT